MVCNIFPALKFENYAEEHKIYMNIKDEMQAVHFNLILGSDHIYTKVLISILLKF